VNQPNGQELPTLSIASRLVPAGLGTQYEPEL